jgi:hypothetical protein
MSTARNDKGGEHATARRGGIDAWEREFIREKRAAGVPDSAIAKMINRPVQMVREVPNLIEPPAPVEPVANTAEPARLRAKPAAEPARQRPPQKAQPRPMPERVQAIVNWVAMEHDVTFDEIVGPSTVKHIARARQQAYAEIRELRRPGPPCLPSYSFAQIARWFGGRDHTTIRQGVATHWERVAQEARRRAA